jgi:formamidopyrimidine-DNA glycosylase
MPELAEVVYFSRQWDAGLHRRVLRVHVHGRSRVFRGGNAAELAAALAGREYLRPLTHGKNMLFRFSGGIWIGGHLGMTGELLALPPDYVPQKHDHLVLYTSAAALVYRDPRMFGRWRLDRGSDPPAWWRALPPEILSKKFSLAALSEFLRRRARTPLKALLLDQSMFPGIGNWMADEVLWQLRLHPATPAGKAAAAALLTKLRAVCRTALRSIGRDWSDPPASWLFRHRWTKSGRCPRCHSPLTRTSLRGRTACWCPKCQDPCPDKSGRRT